MLFEAMTYFSLSQAATTQVECQAHIPLQGCVAISATLDINFSSWPNSLTFSDGMKKRPCVDSADSNSLKNKLLKRTPWTTPSERKSQCTTTDLSFKSCAWHQTIYEQLGIPQELVQAILDRIRMSILNSMLVACSSTTSTGHVKCLLTLEYSQRMSDTYETPAYTSSFSS